MSEFAYLILFRLGIASAFLAGSAIAATVLLAALRCRSPFVHRATWCIVLAQSVLVFQLPIAVPWDLGRPEPLLVRSGGTHPGPSYAPAPVATDKQTHETLSVTTMSSGLPAMNWSAILLIVWLAGVLILLGQWTLRYAWFIRNLAARECNRELWSHEWAEVVEEQGLRTSIPLYISHNVGPMLCRWPTGPRVVVPELLWQRLPREQRQTILRHELAHFQRHDILKSMLAKVVAAVHWFNPLAWFAVRRFEDSVEWTCDRIVQSSAPDAAVHYAKALLALGQKPQQQAAWASAIFGGGLAGRIRRIVSSENAPDSRIKGLLAIGLLIGLSAVHVVRIDVVAQEPTTEAKNIVSEDYFVASVTTDFQKWWLQRGRKLENENVSIYANVNCRGFFDAEHPTLDMDRFDFEAFRGDLDSVRRSSTEGITVILLDFESISGDVKSTHAMAEDVEAAFETMAKNAGYENIVFAKRFANDNRAWKPLEGEAASLRRESRLGNENVSVYPVSTALGRFLAEGSSALGKVDCFIDVATLQPLDAGRALSDEDKEAIRKSVSNLELPDNASALLRVHFQKLKNWNNIREQVPQVSKDAEFHREPVDFLKSLGFDRVGIDVAVSDVHFGSVYK